MLQDQSLDLYRKPTRENSPLAESDERRLEAALTPKKPSKPSRPKKFDGEKEAHLIALACSDSPQGSACWTLRLLAEKMVELKHFSSISHECIRQVLKKTNCALGASSAGVFPELPRKHS